MLQISMEDEETGAIGDHSRIESKPDSPIDALNNTVGEMVNFLDNSRTDIREADIEDSPRKVDMSPLELSKLVADDAGGDEDESLTLASPDIRFRNRGET